MKTLLWDLHSIFSRVQTAHRKAGNCHLDVVMSAPTGMPGRTGNGREVLLRELLCMSFI